MERRENSRHNSKFLVGIANGLDVQHDKGQEEEGRTGQKVRESSGWVSRTIHPSGTGQAAGCPGQGEPGLETNLGGSVCTCFSGP